MHKSGKGRKRDCYSKPDFANTATMTSGRLQQLQVRLIAAHNTLGKLLAQLTLWPPWTTFIQSWMVFACFRPNVNCKNSENMWNFLSITSHGIYYLLPKNQQHLNWTSWSKIAEIHSHFLYISLSLLTTFHCSDCTFPFPLYQVLSNHSQSTKIQIPETLNQLLTKKIYLHQSVWDCTRLAQTVARWQAACEDQQNFWGPRGQPGCSQ